MKILYPHGWNSVPGGVKPTYAAGVIDRVRQNQVKGPWMAFRDWLTD